MTQTTELAALFGLGAFHGLNPGMGWLFAVALGLQERSRQAVLRALPLLALGHAAAVALALVLFETLRTLVRPGVVAAVTGGLLVGYGLWQLIRRRHPRWTGMRLRPAELAVWSFLMATAHGAGLMVVPVAHHARDAIDHPVTGVAAASVADAGGAVVTATMAHTVGMLAAMSVAALVVYDRLGVAVLRRGWFNFDLLWWPALIVAGALVLFT